MASLRQKVKAKVKASLEGGADKGKEANRKNVVQKVRLCGQSSLIMIIGMLY